jgi:hypothetical protein
MTENQIDISKIYDEEKGKIFFDSFKKFGIILDLNNYN